MADRRFALVTLVVCMTVVLLVAHEVQERGGQDVMFWLGFVQGVMGIPVVGAFRELWSGK